MKKILAAIILLLIITAACQKKAAPVITGRKTAPPKKMESRYPPKETVPPDTLTGKSLFVARCSRCHALPEAKQFSIQRWEDILPLMFPRAGLNNEEALHVRAYVLANGAK